MDESGPVRIAVIADTHMPRGPRRLPDRCVEELDRSDLIVHAGDFSEREVLATIQEHGPVIAVRGNVDSADLRSELPESVAFEAAGATIAVLHDAGPRAGRIERMRARFPDADAVVFGHSHMPLLQERDGFAIFNPGSPTERRRAPTRSMGLAVAERGRLRFEHLSLD